MTYADLSDDQLIELHLIGISGFLIPQKSKVLRIGGGFIEVKTPDEFGVEAVYRTVFGVSSGQVEVLFQDGMMVHQNIWKFIKQCQEWGVDYDSY